MKVSTLQEAIARYGSIKNCAWAYEAKWCSVLLVPEDIAVGWINSATGKPTRKIYCNKDMQPALLQSLQNIKDRNLLSELKTFDGCYMIRGVRGKPGALSTHSYALAIDINAKENPLGGPSVLSSEFVACWKDAGFDWGGDFRRTDPMHHSWAWE